MKFNISWLLFYNSVCCCMCVIVQGDYLKDNYPKSVIEDANLDTAQLIQKYKYPVETHYVTTEDKYILRMHRIPKPKAPPVILMHGLQDSSALWILMGPDKAPGYYLSDNGYDVWLGNARGNRYSRNHTVLDPDTDPEFWNFSWHEIGLYDLPAMIDYVLNQTGYKKTGYFGHSQGTTTFFVLCSMRPDYNDKITIMQALGPAVFLNHIKIPGLEVIDSLVETLQQIIYEFLPHNNGLYKTCFSSATNKETCVGVMNLLIGKDEEQTNMTMLPALVGHVPAGCSLKQFEHYRQIKNVNRFCQFDYGRKENMKRYGTSKPPDYPLEKVTVPIGLYYTYNDNIVSEIDVKRLSKTLPNVIEDSLYPFKSWNHLTMVHGIDARQLAHKRMLDVMKNYPYS